MQLSAGQQSAVALHGPGSLYSRLVWTWGCWTKDIADGRSHTESYHFTELLPFQSVEEQVCILHTLLQGCCSWIDFVSVSSPYQAQPKLQPYFYSGILLVKKMQYMRSNIMSYRILPVGICSAPNSSIPSSYGITSPQSQMNDRNDRPDLVQYYWQ